MIDPNDKKLFSDPRVANFYKRKINHPKLTELETSLATILLDSPDNSVYLIIGPSGVGKSTLREKIEHRIQLELAEKLKVDRERMAIVSMEAQSPESGVFNWREHFKLLLEAMHEPLIDLKRDAIARKLGPHLVVAAGNNARVSAGAYQTSVEKAIIARRPIAVFIDEAQNLAKVSSGKRLVDQLDVIKSIANRTKTPHVLIGPYELLRFRNLSGQLSRRGIDLHFPRYHASVNEDLEAFCNAVGTFAEIMPFQEPPSLIQEWDYLYERTIGCVGILKDWLTLALAHALRRNARTIAHADLKKTQMDHGKLNQLLTECIEGEVALQETKEDMKELRIKMGLDKQPIASNETSTEKSSKANRNQTPGTRKAIQKARETLGLEPAKPGPASKNESKFGAGTRKTPPRKS